MTRCAEVVADWSDRLRGAQSAESLLTATSDALKRLGPFEPLTKPGLGRRERWRWSLSGVALYVKRYFADSLRAQLDRIVRQTPAHSRAYWEFAASHRLREAGVPAVRAVAFAEEMSGVLEKRSIVVFESVSGDALDRAWVRLLRERSPLTCGLARADLARRVGRFVAAFHGTGMCHRDLYLCHIFAELDPAAMHPPRFALIDLARVHQPRWRRMRWIIKDLAQLDCSARQIGASRSDRLRALRAYLSLERRAPRVRVYARRIVRKSDAILRRIARKSATS